MNPNRKKKEPPSRLTLAVGRALRRAAKKLIREKRLNSLLWQTGCEQTYPS
jgi:hypothetical protein